MQAGAGGKKQQMKNQQLQGTTALQWLPFAAGENPLFCSCTFCVATHTHSCQHQLPNLSCMRRLIVQCACLQACALHKIWALPSKRAESTLHDEQWNSGP
jgi:hypothetical protein